MEFSFRSTCLIIFLISLSGMVNTEDYFESGPLHPQTKFCESDWVAAVKIKGMSIMEGVYGGTNRVYDIEVKKIFKAYHYAEMALRENLTIWTYMDTDDQLDMRPGQIWVLGGSLEDVKPTIKPTDLYMLYKNLTVDQRLGFLRHYQPSCVCDISEFDDESGCFWESTGPLADCQERHGICMESKSEGCLWRPSYAYNKCLEGL